MKIAIGSDHGGYALKMQLIPVIEKLGHSVQDFGCYDETSVDYPDIAFPVAEAVADGQYARGIIICGTGIGVSICANKVRGIRAANVTSPVFASLAREHNDANVVAVSGRFVDLATNREIVDAFLSTGFGGGRHAGRVEKIAALENE